MQNSFILENGRPMSHNEIIKTFFDCFLVLERSLDKINIKLLNVTAKCKCFRQTLLSSYFPPEVILFPVKKRSGRFSIITQLPCFLGRTNDTSIVPNGNGI